MKRFWLVPLVALSLTGAVSVAQAAPASSMFGTLKATTSHSAATQHVSWRWLRFWRHFLHRGHHHRRV